MALKSAQQAGQAWLNAAPSATQAYVAGVQGTTVDPTALAAAQAQKALLNYSAVINSGEWARRLADAGITKWKQNTLAKQGNYSTGYQAGQTAYEQGYTSFWNYMSPYLNQLYAMPKTTLADSIARATFFIQNAAAYQKP